MAKENIQTKTLDVARNHWLTGDGEMIEVVRTKDWSKTPLGPIESWPQSLRTTVSLCLASNFPISIAWGPERTQIYNDGYWPVCAAKHPHSMGQDFKECWFSAWPVIGEAFERALNGETRFLVNQRMFLDRLGYLEETFFTFSFSPIRDETGKVGGLFHPVTELTQQSLAERRLGVLRNIADRSAEATSIEAALTLIADTLADCNLDVPFALFYRLDSDGKRASLARSVGIVSGKDPSPRSLTFDPPASSDIWPLSRAESSGNCVVVSDLAQRFGTLRCGPYEEAPNLAILQQIALPGLTKPFGFLIVGVSARRPLDDPYRTFYKMLGEAVANALAKARAYEEERKRAEALAELDRAKTAFFCNISHEFRTPLTLMLGPLEDELRETPNGSERLEMVHRNSLRLLKLVNTLLDFSRIEAGRIDAAYVPTDLATYTAELTSVFRAAVEKAGLRLVVDCPPLPEKVYVDRDMWEKIVLNLLSNAFKFTLKGEIIVRQHLIEERVELSVEDTGCGIPESELESVFERFHRIGGTPSRTYEGTGIGLSLVQELTRLHGGAVRVESRHGHGSTFTVSIPLGSSHLPTDQISADRTPAPTAVRANAFIEEALTWLPDEERTEIRGLRTEFLEDSRPLSPQHSVLGTETSRPRILLADDNADMREYVRKLLSSCYDIVAVPDGETALAAALEQPPNLVLTDVMMPTLDGFGLLTALRADPRTNTIPVILLSARAGEESRVEGLKAGADDYLIKPFSAKELLARVNVHVELTQLRQAARKHAEEELWKSEQRFSAIFNQVTTGIAQIDLTGRFVLVNERYCDVVGRSSDELLQLRMQDITYPEDLSGDLAQFKQLAAGGSNFVIEKRYVRADGSIVWVNNSISLVRDADARPKYIVAVTQDITERKRTEQVLRKWEYIFNHAGWAVAAVDPQDNTLMMVNPAFAQMHGYAVEELLGRPVTDTFAPESRAELPQHVAAAHAQGDYVYESLHIRKDGSIFPVLTHVTAFKDEAGRVLYRAATFQDITERKQAEDSKFKLAAIVESSDDAIVSKDFDGTILSWNKGAERIFGYTSAEAVGQNISLLFPPDRLDEEKEIIARIKRGERIADYETVRRRRNGTEIPISLTVSPITNAAGKVIGVSKIARDITERKQAEEALQESEVRTRTIIDTALDAIVTIDREGRIIGWNPQAEVIFGYAVGEVSGRLLSETIIPPRDREAHVRGLRRFLETGAGPILNRRVEVSALHQDGHEFPVELTVSPMQRGGHPVFSAFIRDITERKHAEEALRESEERLRLAVQGAGMGTWDVDLRTGTSIWNRKHYLIMGYNPDGGAATYEMWQSRIHPDDLDHVMAAIEHAKQERELFSPEYRILRADNGEVRWLAPYGRFLYDDRGKAIRFIGIFFDITDRNQTQETLRISEERYRSLVSVLTSVQWTTDREGRFTQLQVAWEDYTGQTWEEHKDFGWAMALHPEDRERVKAIWENAMGGSYYESEGRIWHAASRQYRYFNARAVPLRDATGTVREWVGTFTDIHDRRLAEDEVRRLNRTLEQKVAERTAALEESNQALESFTYSVSHDLRAPLRSMQGFAQALREDYANRLDAVAQDYATRIINGARRMDGLILDLLAYSRLNRTDIALSPVDLWAVVKDTRSQLDTMLSETGACVSVADYLPPVIAHPPTLTQILVNLLSNAAKFVAPGVRPDIRLKTEERGRRVRLWIEDNGIGIAAEHHDRIFRVFERLHGVETYPGTGIGLAIVQKGIERMGGRAGVESKLGAGSRFWIELPAVGRANGPV